MLSIIIPTLNEEENIAALITYLQSNISEIAEIILSDGDSRDGTVEKAIGAGARAVVSPKKGRAAQMNYGASLAKGNILYFVHADTLPPRSFANDIDLAIKEGYTLGRCRTKFNSNRFILKINAFFTRFDLFMCYGGDQTLFITKELFSSLGGFNDDLIIMEDFEIIDRARKHVKYKIIQKDVLISARKYETNSWLRVQRANYKAVSMYKKGYSQMQIADAYKKNLNYR